jgi:hypothetical protein
MATGTLVIDPAPVSVSVSNLTQDYDGTPKAATVVTTPIGINTAVTYNGSPAAPSAVGNYTVVAAVNDSNYAGSATGNLNLRSTLKAFPEAEGTGAFSIGGRGGDVYHVMNLNDAGVGSLRNGIATAVGPRTIVFDLGGTINLDSQLIINKPFLTLAGQTAPGGGITVAGWATIVESTQHVILRYMRFRPGDIRCLNGMEGDALWVHNSKDVIVDHVSASWSIDESLSVTDSDRVTVQWSLIAESLNNSCHPEGRHGYGSLIRYGDGKISYHHNLYAHHFNRNPRVGDNITLDFVNNVIYDWGTDASYSGEITEGITKVNYVGNYLVAGPNTPASKRTRAFNGGSVNTWIYQSGNVIDSNVNGVKDGTDTGWAMFVNLYTQQISPLTRSATKLEALGDVATDPALTAYNRVLNLAGASQARDAVDVRLVNEARNETGTMINSQNDVGGFPALNGGTPPPDTDGDGLPDSWEAAHGLNLNDPADAGMVAANGYTNLENYLNRALVNPTAATGSIAGRVTDPYGRGIPTVKVTATRAATGQPVSVLTNSFGYYHLDGLETGEAYLISLSHKKHRFGDSPGVLFVNGNLSGVDFTSEN